MLYVGNSIFRAVHLLSCGRALRYPNRFILLFESANSSVRWAKLPTTVTTVQFHMGNISSDLLSRPSL